MFPLLKIEHLSISFTSGQVITAAVKDISLEISRGEVLAIVGESGSGKSVTALSILKLLATPPALYNQGSVLFSENGQSTTDLLCLHGKEMQAIRGNKIAMIFQEPMSSLNPVINCGQQVMESLLVHKNISRAAAKKQTIEWFEKVKLPEPGKIFNRFPHQLSGGQKQRVMIAMAMSCRPSLLICDEPTTALDVTVQKTILDLIKQLQQEQNMGVMFITHDLGVVSEIADRVAIMYRGELVEQGATRNIFNRPAHPYTKALIACRPAQNPKGRKLPIVEDYLSEEKKLNPPELKTFSVASNESLMEIENLRVSFPVKTNILGRASGYINAVDGVSFSIYEGEVLGLVGESGCGKTTLGRALLRLADPTSGKIYYRGNDIAAASEKEIKQLRKEVQLVFQDPFSSLNPRITIGDAVEEPMKVNRIIQKKPDRKKQVEALLHRVSLSREHMNRYPHEFSGGQRQRIVIARALAVQPALLVCDESVSALDVSVQAQVLNLLNQLKNELGLTMLFISHDLSVIRYMCDRVLVMNRGKIVESGPVESVYNNPCNAYTKKLIDALPVIRLEKQG